MVLMLPILFALLIILAAFLSFNQRYRWFYILYKTLPRDLKAGIRFFKVHITLKKWEKNQETVAKLFRKLVEQHPDKIAFYFEDETWTYQQLEDFSNQIANYFQKQYKKGDSLALLFENRPEYVGIWLGLSKIGVVTALINTNLTLDPLMHSLNVSNSKGIIYSGSYAKAIDAISEKVNLKLYEFNHELSLGILNGSVNLVEELRGQSTVCPESVESGKPKDKLIYIYTSGTTGLPKAAVISNMRFMFAVIGINHMSVLSSDDIYYDPLPLYHSAGGMIGVGQTLLFGISVALRKKFSASNFWNDCNKYNCTVAHYIGEICRYLLTVHKPGTIVQHQVKKIIGNGMRPQIWKQFSDAFKIAQIYEFYGATEGNSNLINIDNTIGAVGFIPRYAHAAYPVTLIKCNEATGEPIRNPQGLCTRCQPNEPGILIGKINPKTSVSDFAGYADKKATKKKVIENVFKSGDLYFNSGDILLQDELGYYYFKDRTGDTFRWKGENVATTEVEGVISNVVGLKDSVVYGVEIPGTEGRVGMMAIVDPDRTLDKPKLAKGLKDNLPAYAIPMFLRVLDAVPMTGTFKLRKVDLQKEGFDVNQVKDLVYYYDGRQGSYVILSKEMFGNIMSGKVKI